ncbi:AAA family ATPase [Leifsonia sp. NPDC058292]|uniref:AAA family ATPase n=1 Tax=Leifsonia sp. NPDC058292 TaxID=3346428 RepID=UPI0036D85223
MSPAMRPAAYITLGGAGSGKSTVSRHISEYTGALYLDKDVLAGPLVGAALEALGQNASDRESNDVYLRRVMPLEYDALFAVAGQNLRLGHSVVLDAPFVAYLSDPHYLLTAMAGASWPEVPVRVVQVVASAQTVKRRLIERASARDRVKLSDWDAYWQAFGSLKCSWQGAERVQVANDKDNDFSEIDALLGALHA